MHAPVDIKFSCTQCGQRMLVDPAAAGHVTSCPGCAAELTIPMGDSEPLQEGAAAPAEDALQPNSSQELNAMRQRLTHAEAQLGASNRELGAAKSAVAGVEEKLQGGLSERKTLLEKQGLLKRRIAELEASLRDANARCARLDEVDAKLHKSREEASAIAQENDELRRECEQLRRDLTETDSGREIAVLRGQVRQLASEKDRLAKALENETKDVQRFEQQNTEAREQLAELHRRCVDAEKRAEALGSSELTRDNEILRGILSRQKEELEQRYRDLVSMRHAKYALRVTYWIFGIGALGVAAFGLKILSDAL